MNAVLCQRYTLLNATPLPNTLDKGGFKDLLLQKRSNALLYSKEKCYDVHKEVVKLRRAADGQDNLNKEHVFMITDSLVSYAHVRTCMNSFQPEN